MTGIQEGFDLTDLPDGVSMMRGTGAANVLAVGRNGHKAKISMFGAHPIMWQPAGHDDVLWLSDDVELDQARAIRGGVPVCWPWFGGHPQHADWPAHGVARTSIWTLDEVSRVDDAVQVRFSLPALPEHAPFWPHQSRPQITYTIGETFEMALSTTNIDRHSIQFSQALHTYFTIGDIADVSITGLEDIAFIDKLTETNEPAAGAPITFERETDRIYRKPDQLIELHDAKLARTVTVAHTGATSSVVWNPWIEKSARMGDMGPPDAYRGMVCIETGNVPPDDITLAPGETHTLTTIISVREHS